MKRKIAIGIVLVFLVTGVIVAIHHFVADEHKATHITYTCPMHPQIISDKPGSCPICGMDLVPVTQEKTQQSHKDHEMMQGYASITLSEHQADILGITYETVKVAEIIKELRTSAVITANEEKTYKISFRVSGWVEKLYINKTGQFIAKGAPLLSVYSPELYAAVNEYISILNSVDTLSSNQAVTDTLVNLKKSSREKLLLYGLTEKQINDIETAKEANRTITIMSPYSGYVIEKNVYEGQKINSDEILLTVVDLSTVWALADIYQPDLPYVKPGMAALLRIPYWGDKEYKGYVEFIYPYVNEQTRTVKVRAVFKNKTLELKPGLYAEIVLRYSAGKRTAVTEQAVFKTGEKNYVFVKRNDGTLMPQEIILGVLGSNGYYEVLRGVKKGDTVVSPANFLIDSESQLKAVFSNVTEGHKH